MIENSGFDSLYLTLTGLVMVVFSIFVRRFIRTKQ